MFKCKLLNVRVSVRVCRKSYWPIWTKINKTMRVLQEETRYCTFFIEHGTVAQKVRFYRVTHRQHICIARYMLWAAVCTSVSQS